MNGYVEKGDVSIGYGSMNIHTVYQYNGFKSLMNYNDRYDMEMNYNLHNVDVSSGIGLINSNTPPQFNESSNQDEMNWGVKNYNVSGGHCYTNSNTVSEAKNHNYIDSTNKSDENTLNRSEMENTGFQDGVDIDVMLPASTFN